MNDDYDPPMVNLVGLPNHYYQPGDANSILITDGSGAVSVAPELVPAMLRMGCCLASQAAYAV